MTFAVAANEKGEKVLTMNKEYIEREKAIEWFMAFVHMGESDIPAETVISDLKYAIPAADIVEVVRCKDCKYYAAMVTDMVIGDMETATWGICRQPWFNSDEYDVDEDGFCNCGAKMDLEESNEL